MSLIIGIWCMVCATVCFTSAVARAKKGLIDKADIDIAIHVLFLIAAAICFK